MTLTKALLLAALVVPTLAKAELKLDSPEVLIKNAGTSRQQLHEAVMAIQFQLPEIRDIRTFESYFLLCDTLAVEAVRLDLDDIYPKGVESLCQTMSAFGVKWMDLTTMPPAKLAFYVKWMDVEALSNLISYTSYNSKKVTDPALLENLSSNVELVLQLTSETLKDRYDVSVTYRELISSIAIKFLLDPQLPLETKTHWSNKIYTSEGLSLFTDLVQNQIYLAHADNKGVLHDVFLNLEISSTIAKRLLDSPLSQVRDRVNDLIVEAIKRSIELGYEFQETELSSSVTKLGPKHLQSLSGLLTSSSEVLASKNSENFIAVGKAIMPLMKKHGLTTEVFYLNILVSKVYTSMKLDQHSAEGTYEFKDTNGERWRLSIVRPKAFEVLVALGNSKMNVVKSYNTLQYEPEQDVLVAKRTENDPNIRMSLLTIKFDQQGNVRVRDSFSQTYREFTKTKHVEKLTGFDFAKVRTSPYNAVFKGEIAFEGMQSKSDVELIIQTDGVNTTAQLRDKYGVVYELSTGFINENNEFVLTAGNLREMGFTQIRGSFDESGLKARILVGGKGYISPEFKLRRK